MTMTKIIDLPADDPRRKFIDAAIDKMIAEELTPERVRDVLQCALLNRDDRDNDESKKLCWQITMQIKKALIPKEETKTEADVEKWVEIIMRKFSLLLRSAVRKELTSIAFAEVAAGRLVDCGDGTYRRPTPDEKLENKAQEIIDDAVARGHLIRDGNLLREPPKRKRKHA